jgi:hydroxymethylglutaryl-CoA synthase
MTAALQRYAAYVPVGRLEPADVGGREPRVVASFDEDSTTMAVAAASAALEGGNDVVTSLYFATTSPAYSDKTNATTVAAALRLGPDCFAVDLAGAARSAVGAVFAAAESGGLVTLADVRVGKPGSADEKGGADAGAALLFGPGEGIAEVLARVSTTDEFLDRWREPTSLTGQQWEERFGFERYAALVRDTAARALEASGVCEADHVVVVSPNAAVRGRASTLVKGRLTTQGSPLGHAGCADLGVALAAVLDVAGPGETLLLLSAADGCDGLVLRTTELLSERRQTGSVTAQLSAGRAVPYTSYLSWRGLLDRELPRRPEPDRPAAPPSARAAGWKFGFAGNRCTRCGFLHLPPVRVCRACDAVDEMTEVSVATLGGRVATYTVDRLAYSPAPPVVDVVVDFDGGGRCALEVADADAELLAVGSRVDLTFRRLFTAGGVHNYFWKARQVAGSRSEADS